MATDLAVEWGRKLQETRTKRGVSVLELARLAEISPQYVYLLEAGKNTPSDDLRVRLAAALSVRVEDIWSYSQGVAS